MPFTLTVPRAGGQQPLPIEVNMGEAVFVVGANGSGKSSLIHAFYRTHSRISAHRQTWFPTNAITLSPEARRQTGKNIHSWDQSENARWMEHGPEARPNVALFDLLAAENDRAREIAEAADAHDMDLVARLSQKEAPIKKINQLLRLSNVAIEISARKNEEIIAVKNGGTPFSVAQLSDGERNALLIAANVLTAPSATLFLIDEPERHLHRSIISPLLTQLFAKRADCAFVVSTHDVTLAIDNPTARILLVRNCTYNGDAISGWDVDLVVDHFAISDDVKRDILGARRNVIFIEGGEPSLDKPLFAVVFPNVSLIPKSSWRDVQHAVFGIRDAEGLVWLKAFGIIDNDGRTAEDIGRLQARGVYPLSVYAVESIYYHPEIQRRVAERYGAVIGGDVAARLAAAAAAALAEIRPHSQRLSQRVVEKTARDIITSQLPGQPEIARNNAITITVDVPQLVAADHARLEAALNAGDMSAVIARYPIRETGALGVISRELGFQSRDHYESAALRLLMDDNEALNFVRSLFGTLYADIHSAP